ncbi:alpha/beta hydrolase [uncultured Winogradskyella sp.]|uniref:alpha/beta hydrolase n=1 Tax=uncultured Winogradskyella sp. TaxID=395353 RepID=UPI003516E4DE
MKKKLTIILLLITSFSFAQKIESVTIKSEIYGDREILVYTPRLYDENQEKKYEVVYVFDSQARQYFDFVHSSLTFLNSAVPMIVVGVISQERDDDFLPAYKHSETAKLMRNNKGRAKDFKQFLKDDVFGYIETNYRVLPTRLAIGHSNGGVFITYCLVKDPSMFDGYISISPHMRYDNMQMVERLAEFDPTQVKREKFYFLSKGNESSKGWESSIKKTKDFFQSDPVGKVVHFEHQYFRDETHTSIYPKAVITGLEYWFDYQFGSFEKLKEYYSYLKENADYTITENELAGHISQNYWAKDYTNASNILEWGKLKYPKSEYLAYFENQLKNVKPVSDPSNFAEKCLGVWEGTMKIYGYNTLRDSVKVRFTAAKTDIEGTYIWKTEYLSDKSPMVKDYKLIVDDIEKGRYILDESDGVELIEYNVDNKLYSLFQSNGIWLTSTTELSNNKLIFEVTSGKEYNEIKEIKNYSFTNVQRIVLEKVN